MPTTPPRPLSSPPAIASPPTSPQRYQQVIRQQERLQRSMGSPEQRRVPSASTSHFNAFPPPPLPSSPPRPISAPVTSNVQPAEMVFTLNDWQPVLTSSTRGRGHRRGAHPLPVSYFFSFL
jgi:hypothetical protein